MLDGRFVDVTGAGEPGLTIAALPAGDGAPLPEAWGTVAPADAPAHAFVLQNAARAAGGVHVRVARGAAIAHPVVVVHSRGARPDGAPALVAPRVLVEVEPGAAVTVVEDFRGLAAGADFTNAVTEITVAEGAACTTAAPGRRARAGLPRGPGRGATRP